MWGYMGFDWGGMWGQCGTHIGQHMAFKWVLYGIFIVTLKWAFFEPIPRLDYTQLSINRSEVVSGTGHSLNTGVPVSERI